jgi:hypothetical protein
MEWSEPLLYLNNFADGMNSVVWNVWVEASTPYQPIGPALKCQSRLILAIQEICKELDIQFKSPIQPVEITETAKPKKKKYYT